MSFLSNRASHHDHLYHYTRFENALNIIKSKEIWLSPFDKVNDRTEANLKDERTVDFFLSMSADQKENLGMWYLYSEKDGVRLDFSKMKYRIEKPSLKLYDKSEGTEMPLLENGLKQYFSDVLYYNKYAGNNSYVGLNYAGVDFENYSMADYEKVEGLIPRFVKEDIWKHEYETRYVVSIDRRLLDSGDISNYIIKMDATGMFDNTSVICHPEAPDWELFKKAKMDLVSSYYKGRIEI